MKQQINLPDRPVIETETRQDDNPKYKLGLWGRLIDGTSVLFMKIQQWKSPKLDEPRLDKVNTQYYVRDISTNDEFWVDEEEVKFGMEENKEDIFLLPFCIIEVPSITRDGVTNIYNDSIEKRILEWDDKNDNTIVYYELTSGNIVEEDFLKEL